MKCYDLLHHKSKPDLGIDRVSMVDLGLDRFIPRNEAGFPDADLIAEEDLDWAIEKAGGRLTLLNQEKFGLGWDRLHEGRPGTPEGSFDAFRQYCIRFVQRLRQRPGGSAVRVGYFGLPFSDHVWRKPGRYREDVAASMKYSRDEAGRERDLGLADLVDVLIPSFYVRTDSPQYHIEYCDAQLELCRELFERPVCPLVCGHWHPAHGDLAYKYLPESWIDEFAKMMRRHQEAGTVEAVILWGGYHDQRGPWEWDDPLWVKRFIDA